MTWIYNISDTLDDVARSCPFAVHGTHVVQEIVDAQIHDEKKVSDLEKKTTTFILVWTVHTMPSFAELAKSRSFKRV